MRTSPFVVAGLLAASFLVGGFAASAQVGKAPANTKVATVNLGALIEKLQEKAEWEIKLRNLQAQIMDEVKARKSQLEEMTTQINAIADADKKLEAMEKAHLTKLETEQWAMMKERELDREASLMWRQIYKHIREEAAKLAETKGYDYVIVAEPGDELQLAGGDARVPLTQRALDQIGRRRMLYSSPAHDITEELRTRMDNAYAIGQ